MVSDDEKSLFDPLECARLHNDLVRLAGYVDGAQSSRDAIRLCSPELRARLSPKLQTFLTRINARPSNTKTTTIMPFCHLTRYQHLFEYKDWSQFRPHADNLVLIFSDNRTVHEGGLFFDQRRELACWIDPSLGFPLDESWIPLADILRRWIRMWDTRKITDDHKLQPTGSWDFVESLRAWNELLTAIESRLPGTTIQNQVDATPLVDREVATKCTDQFFHFAFLTNARRPTVPNLKIAPGITVWTSDSLKAIHKASLDDEFHILSRILYGGPSLLFPAETTSLVSGLYLSPDDNWSDAVLFVNGVGVSELFTYVNEWCPWMRVRPSATLREVLAFWKSLIEDGIWKVGEHGVMGGMEYFDHLHGTTKVVNVDGIPTEVNFRAEWNAAPTF